MSRTLFDKIWETHCIDVDDAGDSLLYIDRTCLHERTGSVALQSLADANLPIRHPKKAYCVMDHIVDTFPGRGDTTLMPGGEAFIVSTRSNAAQFEIRTFDVGDVDQGISHLVSAEQGLALPGLTLVCPDSHTCTLGALGTLAFGIGTSEAEHALATSTLSLTKPNNMRVIVNGKLASDVTAKDLALYLIGEYGSAFADGSAVEFSGAAISDLSVEGRMTLCNMAVECAAFTAIIAPDEKVFEYVAGRPFAPTPLPTESWQSLFSDANAHFDATIELDASIIQPQVTWGISPDQGVGIQGVVPNPSADDLDGQRALEYMQLEPNTAISEIAIDAAFIGSCTNARLSDLRAAAEVLQGRQIAPNVAAVCVPASSQVRRAAEAEGLDKIFIDAGFEWRESGCSMCFYAGGETFGPGKRVITSTNRNFEGRQGPKVRSHLASPAVVAASAIRGTICTPAMLDEAQP